MHYRRAGDAGPRLFLLHQSPLSSRQFDRCLPLLGESSRAVALDTPGYGNSDPPHHPVSLSDYAERMLEAIEKLCDGEFALAGFHTGAGIALEVAQLARKARITHLILTGVPLLSADQLSTLLDEMKPPEVLNDGSHLTREWRARYRNWGETGGLEQVQVAVAETISVYERYRWGFEALQGYDPIPALEALRCPVLFVTSERDSLRDEDRRAAQHVSRGKIVNLGEVAPQLPWTAPLQYAREILEFMGTK